MLFLLQFYQFDASVGKKRNVTTLVGLFIEVKSSTKKRMKSDCVFFWQNLRHRHSIVFFLGEPKETSDY